ncbi:MAG: hypothetical protein H6739_33510 [Alphaproteobacteria bacterium]|nr:hypothetical protein [Alphaproteobacteria bacterium]
MHTRPLALLLVLCGCLKPIEDSATDDSGDPTVDADGDGATADVDCDDNDNTTYPGAPEQCDGVDNDCNGTPDDGLMQTWYRDDDGDMFGDDADTQEACEAPAGYVTQGGDCDDGFAAVYPGAQELCDGVDNDCDETVDYDIDVLRFDTLADRVIIEHEAGMDFGPAGTLEAWLWWNGDGNTIIQKYQEDGAGGAILESKTLSVAPADRKLRAGGLLEGEVVPVRLETDASVMPTDTWTHIAWTWDQNRGRVDLYIDGSRVDTTTIDGPLANADGAIYLGSSPHVAPSEGFTGLLADVRLSSTVRYDGTFSPDAYLESDTETLFLFHLDEGLGTLVSDASGNIGDGSIMGPSWSTVPCR